MKKLYAALILILIIPISAYAQGEVAESTDESSDDCLSCDIEEEMDTDIEISEIPSIDIGELCEILLMICLELELTEDEIYELIPDLWEADYEISMFGENDLDQ